MTSSHSFWASTHRMNRCTNVSMRSSVMRARVSEYDVNPVDYVPDVAMLADIISLVSASFAPVASSS